MQLLWSRASQATSRCGCRTCSTVAQSAGRRVVPPRRKPTFAEIFTAAYTSVFASAAVLDSGFKEKRRRELDQRLEDAKRDLAAARQRNEVSLDAKEDSEARANLDWLTDHQMDVLWKTIKMTRPYLDSNESDSALLRQSALRQQLQLSHYNCAGSNLPKLWDLSEQNRIDQAIMYEESNVPNDQRNPITDQQLHELARDITTLVRKMMQRVRDMNKNCKPMSSPTFIEVEQMLANREYAWYLHPSLDPEAARREVLDLNRSCHSATINSKLGVQEQVGRVCFNLMVSKYPPDMTTVDTLISSFNRFQQLREFSHMVTWENFQWLKFKPTACTFAAALHNYRSVDDHKNWKWMLRCIVGDDRHTGAKYMRRHVGDFKSLRADEKLSKWASQTHLRTRTGDYIYDHAPLNALIVEQILHGLLWFGRLGSSVSFFTSCLAVQVPVPAKMARSILNECVAALDWQSALSLVQNMVRYGQLWWMLIVDKDSWNIGYLIDRMYSILDMIGLGSSADFTSEERLEQLGLSREGLATLFESLDQTNEALDRSEKVRRTRGSAKLDDATRASRSRTLQIESLDKELTRASLRAGRTEDFVFDLGVPLSAPLLAHASNAALAKGQALGDEVAETLSILRSTSDADRKQAEAESFGQEPVPYWAERSTWNRLTTLNMTRYRAAIDWKLDSTRHLYGQTVSVEKPTALPFWISGKQDMRAAEVATEYIPKTEKAAQARALEAPRASRVVPHEEQEAERKVMKSNLVVLNHMEVQERRAAYP